MSSKKKVGALPRGGGLKTTSTSNNKRPSQASPPPPISAPRRSARIRNQKPNNAPELLAQTQTAPEVRICWNVEIRYTLSSDYMYH
ncbi:hypothetical protein F4823DRAFT_619749 [Ustulina deusta]|nr:hypothetical protein F4823DRAFT_619749 [Ustulina deusta]